MFNEYPPPVKRKAPSDSRHSTPEISTGMKRFPLNTLSESQPASTVPAIPKASENAMICVAPAREKPLPFWRKSTPHSLTACWVMYTKALERAIIHIPG